MQVVHQQTPLNVARSLLPEPAHTHHHTRNTSYLQLFISVFEGPKTLLTNISG